MKTAIVLRIEGRKAVVLKSDGSFASVDTKAGWKEGSVISLRAAKKNYIRVLQAVAACLAVVLLGGFGWNRLYVSTAAIVSLDVNPSIELRINRVNRVVSAQAMNAQGSQILSKANIDQMSFPDALHQILAVEENDGFLTPGANVVLTVFAANPSFQSSLLSESQRVVDTNTAVFSSRLSAEYHVVDERFVDGAHGHGVTAGKYIYLEQLQSLSPETDIALYTHHSIDQLKGEIQSCRQEHASEETSSSHGDHGGAEGCR